MPGEEIVQIETDQQKIARLEREMKERDEEAKQQKKILEELQKTMNAMATPAAPAGGEATAATVQYQHHSYRPVVPRLEEGMSWEDYNRQVGLWADMDPAPKDKLGLLLLAALPTKGDRMGGLQAVCQDKLGLPAIKSEQGLEKLLGALKEMMVKPTYCRVVEWYEDLCKLRQKGHWDMLQWVNSVRDIVKRAKADLGFDMPDILQVGLLMARCVSIEPGIMASIMSKLTIKSGEPNLVENVENAMLNFVVPYAGKGNMHGVKMSEDSDRYGSRWRRNSEEYDNRDHYEYNEGFLTKNKGGGKWPKRGGGQQGGRVGGRDRGRDGGRDDRGASGAAGGGGFSQREADKRKALDQRLCFKCHSPNHRVENCPQKREELQRRKEEQLRNNIPWRNQDGTYSLPNGTRVTEDQLPKGTLVTQHRGPHTPPYAPRDNVEGMFQRRGQTSSPHRQFIASQYEPAQLEDAYDGELQLSLSTGDVESLFTEPPGGQDYHKLSQRDLSQTVTSGEYEKIMENALLGQSDQPVKSDVPMSDAYMNSMLDDVESDEVQSALVSENLISCNTVMVSQENSVNEAVVDTGCTRSVAGVEWTRSYIQNMSAWMRDQVRKKESFQKFKFGSDMIFPSLYTIVAPVYLGGKLKYLSWDVVETGIPLLISLAVMKRLGLAIQFVENGNDIATFEGVSFELISRGGHQKINIAPPANAEPSPPPPEVLTASNTAADKSEIYKLHIQMAHPTKENLEKKLKRAGRWGPESKEAMEQVWEECLSKDCRSKQHCQKIRKVGARQPERFGELVSADLKIAGKSNDKDVLYIVDHFTNFVIAETISSKRPEHIAEIFLDVWYSKGFPKIKTLLTDCGTEFLGNSFQQFLEGLNVKHIVTVPRTPQMNGQCERVHGLVDLNVHKLRQDNSKMSQKVALNWACFAWNTLEKRHGYCPADLVFGPSERETSFNNLGPAELQCDRDIHYNILLQLMAKEKARVSHLQLRSSEKVREALYRKIIPSRENKPIGTWVWLKRSEEKEWRGPGQVTYSLHSQCGVKIGNTFYTARHEDCLPLNEREMFIEGILSLDVMEQKERWTMAPPFETETTVVTKKVTFNPETEVRVLDDEENSVDVQHQLREAPQSAPVTAEQAAGELPDGAQPPVAHQPGASEAAAEEHDTPAKGTRGGKRLKKRAAPRKTVIPFYSPLGFAEKEDIWIRNLETNTWESARILDRYYPAKDDGGEWYRLRPDLKNYRKDLLLDLKYIDWRQGSDPNVNVTNLNESAQLEPGTRSVGQPRVSVSKVMVTENETHQVKLVQIPFHQHNSERVRLAKAKELETLRQFKTFEDVDIRQLNVEQKAKIIPSTWSVVLKDVNNAESVKARLCARGDKEVQTVRTDSPTVGKASLRLILASAASLGEKLSSMDFKGAFLQGQPIDREVYLLPPQDIRDSNPNLVWRVIKRLYGFKDASRGWYLEFDRAMKALGCEQSLVDSALYVWKDRQGNVAGRAGVHVDDVLYAGTPEFHDKVINKILSQYVIGRVETGEFTFTGWTLSQTKESIKLTQEHFLTQVDLEKYQVFKTLKSNEGQLLNEELQGLYRSLVGQIQWITSVSRPDKAYYSVALAAKLGSATLASAKTGLKQLEAMVRDPQTLTYSALDLKEIHVRLFTDSSWGKLDQCETVNANIMFLVDSSGRSCILDWQALKQAIPSASPLAGEAEAALGAYGKVSWIRSLVKDVFGVEEIPATIVTDSRSLQDAVNASTTMKDKRALVAVCAMRRMHEVENISLQWCQGSIQVADVMTKPSVNAGRLRSMLQAGNLADLEY